MEKKTMRELSPPSTAYASRCNASEIRHWRSEGFIEGVGERVGKGHLYDTTDVACIAVAAAVARHGFGYREAFRIIAERRAQIDDLVRTIRAVGGGSDYVLTFALNFDIHRGYQSITAAPIEKCALDPNIPGALQVNVSRIIHDVIERLRFFDLHGAETADAA
jgi:hypothetical protein